MSADCEHIPVLHDPTGGDPWMGGPVYITICSRCGLQLQTPVGGSSADVNRVAPRPDEAATVPPAGPVTPDELTTTLAEVVDQHYPLGFSPMAAVCACDRTWRPHEEMRAHLAAVLVATVTEAQEVAGLCSQCGERMSCMVKVGTADGWCEVCLDEAADTTVAAVAALRSAADDIDQQVRDRGTGKAGIHILAPAQIAQWLRARADSLVDRAERGQG